VCFVFVFCGLGIIYKLGKFQNFVFTSTVAKSTSKPSASSSSFTTCVPSVIKKLVGWSV
jgi:hypothetical protein